MALISVKLAGVRIHHVVPVTVGGKPGTECLIDEADLPALKASGLVAWDQKQDAAAMPAAWCNKDGSPRHVFAGYDMPIKAVMALDEPVGEVIEEKP
jgi:hypothetical protein